VDGGAHTTGGDRSSISIRTVSEKSRRKRHGRGKLLVEAANASHAQEHFLRMP